MESAETALKINHVVYTKVKKIEVITDSLGDSWYVNFDGSWESLCFGKDDPGFKVGDKMKITFERIDNG